MARNSSNFTCSHLDLNFFSGEKPPESGPLLRRREKEGYIGGEKIKGFLPLKEGRGKDKGWARWKEGKRSESEKEEEEEEEEDIYLSQIHE